MWVRLVPGFDRDGLLIPKWRDAFLLRGAPEGELTIGDEEVVQLRRRAQVARLTINGQDVLPPLVDVVVRYARDKMMTLSGISEEEPWNRWRAQAWRMEVMSLERSAPPQDKQEQQLTMNKSEGTE